jgi:uncharacterized protein (TIGR03790 family)
MARWLMAHSVVAGWLVMACLATQTARAELLPDELAVVAMRDSPQSVELAEYYVRARGLPDDRICLLDGPPGADLSRVDWETTVRPAIRSWLVERGLSAKVRCFVTVWDVPLKIVRADPADPVRLARIAALNTERAARFDQLKQILFTTGRILAPDAADTAVNDDASVRDLAKLFQDALRAAAERAQASTDAAGQAAAVAQIEQAVAAATGRAGMAQFLESIAPSSDPAQVAATRQRIEFFKGEHQGLRRGVNALVLLPERVERDQMVLEVLEQSDGILGTLGWLDEQRQFAERNETYASFDSELSLLDWPDYPLAMWQPNALYHRHDGSDARRMRPTRMVARIEAPTLELAKGLIDTAIAVERTGLEGQCYVDARGIAVLPGKRSIGSYGDYDECLRNLADLLPRLAGQETKLDDRGELFQAGDCPDAALYCGWYSLSNYVDAFDWRPGAVAYHIASGEAATLRDPASNVWCKRMIEEGVCATLGPVFEPYLGAFPRPDEFFPLLLSGRYTLVETYYRTLPFNSWVMVLVGDPLYNPYKAAPRLTKDGLPEEMRQLLGLAPGGSAAGDRPE